MFSMAIISSLNMYGLSMESLEKNISMKPHKTTFSTNTSVSSSFDKSK